MSLDWHLVPDAWADLRRLDPNLQEDVLDEMERLADQPELIPAPTPGQGIVQRLPRWIGPELRILLLSLHRSPNGQRLILMGVDELIVRF